MSLRQRVLPALIVAGLSLAVAGGALAGARHDGAHDGPMVAKFDRDGDGTIKVAQIEADAAKRAADIDSNADGRITAAEVDAHRERMRQARAEQRLLRLDADKDGSVSTEEYASGQSGRLVRLDKDGDGVISREEFRAGRHGRHERRGGHRGPRGEAPAE